MLFGQLCQFSNRGVKRPRDISDGRPRRIRVPALDQAVGRCRDASVVSHRFLGEPSLFAKLTNGFPKTRLWALGGGHESNVFNQRGFGLDDKQPVIYR